MHQLFKQPLYSALRNFAHFLVQGALSNDSLPSILQGVDREGIDGVMGEKTS